MLKTLLQSDCTLLKKDEFLRLFSITLVMENGSEADRRSPFAKADEICSFVKTAAYGPSEPVNNGKKK